MEGTSAHRASAEALSLELVFNRCWTGVSWTGLLQGGESQSGE